MEYLDWNSSYTDRTVSFMYEWLFYVRISRSAPAALCTWFFLTYPLCGSFFPDGGWNQTILHTVSGGRYCFPDPGIFRGFAAFLCKCSGDAGTICRTDGTDRTFVYRYSLLRSCLYPAGHWSERSEPDGCFSADESGISIFRSGRLGTPA